MKVEENFLLAPSVFVKCQSGYMLRLNGQLVPSCLQRCLGDALGDAGPLRTPDLRLQLRGLRPERQRKPAFLTVLLILCVFLLLIGCFLTAGLLLVAHGHLQNKVSKTFPSKPQKKSAVVKQRPLPLRDRVGGGAIMTDS